MLRIRLALTDLSADLENSMSKVSLITLLIFPVIVLGPLVPVLPLSQDITMRAAMALVFATASLAVCLGHAGHFRMSAFALTFGLLTCAVPILSKEYNSFFFTIIFSATLGLSAFRYFKSPGALLVMMVVFSAYLFAYFILNGDLDAALYATVGSNIVGASRNFIGVALLQFYLAYYAVCVALGKPARHWPIFLMAPIAVMSAGVSSAIVSLLLIAVFLILRLKVGLKSGLWVLGFVILAATASRGWLESSLFLDRLTAGDFVISRLLLWTDFFGKLDSRSIIIGFPSAEEFIDHEVNLTGVENLHNSFLNLYKRVGIFALPYYALIAYTTLSLWWVHRMLFAIFVITLLRASTDGYYFSTFTVDFVLFYLFLLTPLGKRLIFRIKSFRAEGTSRPEAAMFATAAPKRAPES